MSNIDRYVSMVLVATVSWAGWTIVARADALPRYDPPTYCQKVSQISGSSQMIYNGCMEMEQEAYDSLKGAWNEIPAKTKAYCDKVARASNSAYSILKGCVDMENEAASSTPEFKY